MPNVADNDPLIDSVAPPAVLFDLHPDKALTPSLQQQVVAMARLDANTPGKLSQDDLRTVCRTLLFHVANGGA